VNLGLHSSLDFAVSVRDAGIPFVFASGYGENVDLGAFHRSSLTVTKPYGLETLGAVIAKQLHTSPI
jgi:hypothetical protein